MATAYDWGGLRTCRGHRRLFQLNARTALHGVDMQAGDCDCSAFCHGAEADTLNNLTNCGQWCNASVQTQQAGLRLDGQTGRICSKLSKVTELLECWILAVR